MPIVTPDPPRQSLDALSGMYYTLTRTAGLKRAAPRFAARIMALPSELRTPGLSYRLYVLGLADIVEGEGLRQAKLSCWRHEFISEGEVVTADVTAGRRPRFAALNVHASADSVQRELASDMFDASNFGPHSYEAAVLQIPALAIRAIWLKSRSRSHEDVVVPFAPVRPELTAHRRYTPAEFVDAIRPLARAALAADAPGKGA